MIANLMMYQRPELVDAHKRYWALIREQLAHIGIKSPENLSQDAEEFMVWEHPQLVLSQTCGMPYRLWLHEKVQLVGTPDFAIEGCPPGYYRSPFMVRVGVERTKPEQFADAVFAYNQTFSQSGFAAPYNHLKPKGDWFENLLHTGAHLESARAVAEGRADICALDAVSWRLMEKYEPFAQGLRILEWTQPTPGLPYITAPGNDADLMHGAVKSAIDGLSIEDRNAMGIAGFVRIPAEKYLDVANPDVPQIHP
ncbi:MAG: phosphate/phosphite/phosphonate ABC transporter substrate-binding protein [Hyphomicrobiales bacterium]